MLVLHRFFETLRCLDDFLTSAGEGRLGRGARIIRYAADVLMGIAIVLYALALIIYGIDVAYLKVPVSKAFRESLWFSSLFITVFFTSFDLLFIGGYVSLVLGLRRLANALPVLINGSETPEGVPECVSDYFRGDAAETLSRVYRYLLLPLYFYLFAIPLTIFIPFMILTLVNYLSVSSPSSLLEILFASPSLEKAFEDAAKVVVETVVRTVLGFLGIVITIAFSVGSLFIRDRAESRGALNFINNVRFFMFEQFAFAIFIIIISMAIPPIIAISFFIPLTLAITIDLIAYIMLAITVIEHMQSPRGRPRRRSGRLRGPWG
jgi:hypothetical protein